jgi:hypothetical protein
MLTLLETTVHLRKFSKREEIHGKDMIPAIDLAISQKGPASLLDMIHPRLREALFMASKDGTPAAQQALDVSVDLLPNVRVPSLQMPLAIDYEQTGHSLRVHYGANEKAHVVLGLVKLHKLKIVEVVEGPSIELHYSLSCANEINEKVIGKLGILGGHDIVISLDAPEVQPEPDAAAQQARKEAEAQVSPGFLERGAEPNLTAEDIFTAGGATAESASAV